MLVGVLVFVVIVILLFSMGNTGKNPEIQLAKPHSIGELTPSKEAEAAGKLPRVITLYQKGEGESDLAAFVSRELAKEGKLLASFRSINVTEDPQAAVYYGVTEHPTIVFIRPNGRIYLKHEGYLDKAKIKALTMQAAEK